MCGLDPGVQRQQIRQEGELFDDAHDLLDLSRGRWSAWPYLWLDATYLKVREGGRIVSRAVIIAVAVNDDGKREVLGMAVNRRAKFL